MHDHVTAHGSEKKKFFIYSIISLSEKKCSLHERFLKRLLNFFSRLVMRRGAFIMYPAHADETWCLNYKTNKGIFFSMSYVRLKLIIRCAYKNVLCVRSFIDSLHLCVFTFYLSFPCTIENLILAWTIAAIFRLLIIIIFLYLKAAARFLPKKKFINNSKHWKFD